MSKTLNLLTNAHAIRDRPTLKDVKREFWNRSVHESVAIYSFDNVDSEDITSSVVVTRILLVLIR